VELAASLEDLRAAQDRLIQTEKLASLGQLTAGIAHEIKNPLNFVNNFATLSVELVESGGGISPEVKNKIFNPFFTTKPPGEGTGLGLSLSYDIIVKQHSGSIEIDTQPGEFTEFRVILPRAAARTRAGATP
jgi:signal transduction histidine kinase